MRLQVIGHCPKRGYAISVVYSDEELTQMEPGEDEVQYVTSHRQAYATVDRWNRKHATH